MRISVLTIFPEMFRDFLAGPVIRRAVDQGAVSIEILDIKRSARGSFRHIDDDTYGGGAGMVMRAGPILETLREALGEEIQKAEDGSDAAWADPAGKPDMDPCVVVLSPSGRLYTQKTARVLSEKKHLILICGHYEGIDERIMKYADAEISVGDYVLTGGELPAMTVMDSVVRLLGGVLRKESTKEESFEDGLLEYPQYTKPAVLDGDAIPDVLLSGNHEKIRTWRLRQSLLRTLRRRPDLLEKRGLTEEERKLLEECDLSEEERFFLKTISCKGQ